MKKQNKNKKRQKTPVNYRRLCRFYGFRLCFTRRWMSRENKKNPDKKIILDSVKMERIIDT